MERSNADASVGAFLRVRVGPTSNPQLMTFVTKLSFQSGDRDVLEETVVELKEMLERKGAECKGPNLLPPRTLTVPLYKRLDGGERFPSNWSYTVYSRELKIHGSDDVAREVATRELPDSIHVEVEIDRKKPLGHTRDS